MNRDFLLPIVEKRKEITSKFHAMSESKGTYDIGKFELKRGQCSRVQDLQETAAATSDIMVEDDGT